MRVFLTVLLGSAVLAILAPQGIAHFRLLEPGSWLQEGQNGDPQKDRKSTRLNSSHHTTSRMPSSA